MAQRKRRVALPEDAVEAPMAVLAHARAMRGAWRRHTRHCDHQNDTHALLTQHIAVMHVVAGGLWLCPLLAPMSTWTPWLQP